MGSAGIPPTLMMQGMLHFLPLYLKDLYRQHKRGNEDELIELGLTFQCSMSTSLQRCSKPFVLPCSIRWITTIPSI